MARIAGVNLPTQKRLEIGLTYIYGIGKSTSQKIIRELELDPEQKVRDLTDEEVTKLRNYIDSEVEVELADDLLRGRLADPVDVRQPDLEPLLRRKVDSGDACHAAATPAFACAGGWSR